jgi:ATP-dependent Lon protease
MVDAGSMNPVVLLDEIDKVGADWRGDPSAALLEVLDPAQNATFRDHYLETELDLSEVCSSPPPTPSTRSPPPCSTAWRSSPRGLHRGREGGHRPDHLLPGCSSATGSRGDEVVIGDEVIRTVVADYTREAGVRRLEQRLDRLVRRAISSLVQEPDRHQVVVTLDDLRPALGPPR